MNLFAGQEQRQGRGEQPNGHSRGGASGPGRVALRHAHSRTQNRQPVGGCRIAQGFNSALWGVGWGQGRGFKSKGARVYLRRSTLLVAEPTQHCKAIILQLKSKKERKKTGTYIKWNISHWKEWNNAICRNIGEPGDYHPEWSNQAKTSITWYCLYAGS